jgi:hypothetical protein
MNERKQERIGENILFAYFLKFTSKEGGGNNWESCSFISSFLSL